MSRMVVLGATLMIAVLSSNGRIAAAQDPTRNVVVEWNQVLQDTIPGAGNVVAPRFYALTHIAMFDAINAIEREFESYHARPHLGDGGAPAAAAAQAAHDVLVALNPPATAAYDALLVAHLGKRPTVYEWRGAAVGRRVAKEILTWRQQDGWVVTAQPVYSEPLLPGRWRPTPPNNPAAAFTHLHNAVPLALLTGTQYLPPPPPALTSERYARDLNEVKLLGGVDSAARTPQQTEIARLWAGLTTAGTGTSTTLFGIWNNVARDVARERQLSLLETARVFALVNVTMHDGLQTTQVSKFVYGLWRPVTAIREADTDLNPATDPDPGWLPLITTPPYPSYAGNMAVVGAGAARALQLAFGATDIPITLTWRQSGGLPDVSHPLAGFWEAAHEQSMARIYGGVHYRFDQEAGHRIGTAVADFVFTNYMTPRRRGNE